MKIFIESLKLSFTRIKGIVATISFLWIVICALLPNETNLKVCMLMLLFGLLIIFIVFILIEYKSIRRSEIDTTVMKKYNKHLCIYRNDYCENMRTVISNQKYSNKNVCYAMGIDRTGDLSISAKKGIVYSVIRFIISEYNIPLEYIQNSLDNAMKEQFPEKHILDFGDVLVLNLDIKGYKDSLRLLLVANSEKTIESERYNDIELISGPDSRKMVLNIFEKCNEIDCNTLFLGAIGTNGLDFPYSVIITEIINCFACAIQMKKSPNNVILSVRTEDMERHGIKYNELVLFVRQLMKLYGL